jgi:hypothetical protein
MSRRHRECVSRQRGDRLHVQARWLYDDMLEMEHLESDTQAVVLDPKANVVYVATADNGFDE